MDGSRERRCIVSGEILPEGRLIRFAVGPEGLVVPDVEAKLPLLATYMGHGSAVSTHYYLHFIEPLRTAASERFARHYGELVSAPPQPARRRG